MCSGVNGCFALQTGLAFVAQSSGREQNMSETDDPDQGGRDDGDGVLEPGQAAELIKQTQVRARREFETSSPVAAVLGAAVFLFGYGAVWWSLHDQQVYAGPAGWSIVVLYGLIVVAGIVAWRLFHRATSGVGGRTHRQMVAAGVALATASVAAWTVQGALRYLGAGFEIVYGVYGPTVPLIALTAASTGFAASLGKWPELCLAVAIMLIAAGSTFFGPMGAWGLTGVGCAVALVVYAVVVSVRFRRFARS